MAVLRAFQATDMRAELGFGIPVAFDRSSIVVDDTVRTTTFLGNFFYPLLGGSTWFPAITPFDRLRAGGVEGILLGYEQDRLGLPQYQVEGVLVDAAAAFFALFRLGDTGLFQRLAFASDDTFFGSRAVDVLIGFGGNDLVSGFGGADALFGGLGVDRLYGGDGADRIRGGAGRDWLFGGRDDDRLSGGAGDDALDGGDGDDGLVGGRGQDRLHGGHGADTFRFLLLADSPTGSSRRDFIRDFTQDQDLIDLRAIDADAGQSGDQPFAYIGANPFTGDAGQLRFGTSSRLVQGDTDGDGLADLEIEIGGSVVPAADDFLL